MEREKTQTRKGADSDNLENSKEAHDVTNVRYSVNYKTTSATGRYVPYSNIIGQFPNITSRSTSITCRLPSLTRS